MVCMVTVFPYPGSQYKASLQLNDRQGESDGGVMVLGAVVALMGVTSTSQGSIPVDKR